MQDPTRQGVDRVSRLRDPELSRSRDSEISEFRNCENSGIREIDISRSRCFYVSAFWDFGISMFWCAGFRGCDISRARRSRDFWIRGFPSMRFRCFEGYDFGISTPRCRVSEILGFDVSSFFLRCRDFEIARFMCFHISEYLDPVWSEFRDI